MFERYTEQARRALFFGRYEASHLGHLSIETEHLLLGLLRENKGIASRIFERRHIAPEDVRQDIESRRGRPAKRCRPRSRSRSAPRPSACCSSPPRKPIGSSTTTSAREHLLLGLLREEGSVGASILVGRGLTARHGPGGCRSAPSTSTRQLGNVADLTLKLSGYTTPEQQLFRNVLFDQLYASLPKDPQAKVQIYNAEIAPGGYTNWHCHNGATFFIALQGIFEAEFQEGILIKAKAGDVYSEPIARFHRGHNPHPEVPYLCIGVCITAPDREHVTNAISQALVSLRRYCSDLRSATLHEGTKSRRRH